MACKQAAIKAPVRFRRGCGSRRLPDIPRAHLPSENRAYESKPLGIQMLAMVLSILMLSVKAMVLFTVRNPWLTCV